MWIYLINKNTLTILLLDSVAISHMQSEMLECLTLSGIINGNIVPVLREQEYVFSYKI